MVYPLNDAPQSQPLLTKLQELEKELSECKKMYELNMRNCLAEMAAITSKIALLTLRQVLGIE